MIEVSEMYQQLLVFENPDFLRVSESTIYEFWFIIENIYIFKILNILMALS